MTLAVHNLEIVYDDVMLAVKSASLQIAKGGITALLGANGAGKTTLLRGITGLLDVHRGKITKGRVSIDEQTIDTREAPAVLRAGVGQVMEGRRILLDLTVEENLRVGAFTCPSRAVVQDQLERTYERFPVLRDRRGQQAGYLSGGEQQILAISRTLMAHPTYLLLDEPSLGLAPRMVEQIRDLIVEISASGTGVLLVEQNAAMALSIADHGYVMENGRIVMDAPAAELRENEDIREFYLGAETSERSLRDVKRYKRRKRWLS